MSLNQDNSEHEGEGQQWRNSAISVAVVGAIIAVMFYSAHSPARQESGVEPSSSATVSSAEVRDCIRAKRIEIVDDAGKVVGVVHSVGRGKEASAVLELVGHGAREGRMVHMDPQRVVISGDGGVTEFRHTGVEWKATMPSGKDDVMVRIGADSNGGSGAVKSSGFAIQSDSSPRVRP